MGIVLSYAFAHIIEAVILWMSMSQMYEHRYKQWLTGTIIMIGHAVMFAVFLMGNIYFITIVNIMTYIVLIYVLFFVTNGSALFWTANHTNVQGLLWSILIVIEHFVKD